MSERLAKSAGLIGAATLSSRVLGLVRDVAQAHYFGTSLENDAFVVATRIPTLLRDLFAEGAMSAAFVPTFTRYLTTEGQGGGVATGIAGRERSPSRHGRAGRARDHLRGAAREAVRGERSRPNPASSS